MALKKFTLNRLYDEFIISSRSNPNIQESNIRNGFYVIPNPPANLSNVLIIDYLIGNKKSSYSECNTSGDFYIGKNEADFKSLTNGTYDWQQSYIYQNSWYISNPPQDMSQIINELYQNYQKMTLGNSTQPLQYNFKRDESQFTCLNCSTGNEWASDDNETNVWYYINAGNNTQLSQKPINIIVNGSIYTEVSEGTSLQAGQWKWEKDPTDAYYTIYIYDDSGQDIDDKPAGYVKAEIGSETITLYINYTGSDLLQEPVTYLLYADGTERDTFYIKYLNDSILTKTIKTKNENLPILTIPQNNVFVGISLLIYNDSDEINKVSIILRSSNDTIKIFEYDVDPKDTLILDSKFVMEEGDTLEIDSFYSKGTIILSGDLATIS